MRILTLALFCWSLGSLLAPQYGSASPGVAGVRWAPLDSETRGAFFAPTAPSVAASAAARALLAAETAAGLQIDMPVWESRADPEYDRHDTLPGVDLPPNPAQANPDPTSDPSLDARAPGVDLDQHQGAVVKPEVRREGAVDAPADAPCTATDGSCDPAVEPVPSYTGLLEEGPSPDKSSGTDDYSGHDGDWPGSVKIIIEDDPAGGSPTRANPTDPDLTPSPAKLGDPLGAPGGAPAVITPRSTTDEVSGAIGGARAVARGDLVMEPGVCLSTEAAARLVGQCRQWERRGDECFSQLQKAKAPTSIPVWGIVVGAAAIFIAGGSVGYFSR